MKPIELLGGLTQGALSLMPSAPVFTVLGDVLFLVGVMIACRMLEIFARSVYLVQCYLVSLTVASKGREVDSAWPN